MSIFRRSVSRGVLRRSSTVMVCPPIRPTEQKEYQTKLFSFNEPRFVSLPSPGRPYRGSVSSRSHHSGSASEVSTLNLLRLEGLPAAGRPAIMLIGPHWLNRVPHRRQGSQAAPLQRVGAHDRPV
jgi:hypothetical protein